MLTIHNSQPLYASSNYRGRSCLVFGTHIHIYINICTLKYTHIQTHALVYTNRARTRAGELAILNLFFARRNKFQSPRLFVAVCFFLLSLSLSLLSFPFSLSIFFPLPLSLLDFSKFAR